MMKRTGRPPAMPAQARREIVYAAAERLFCEQGYDTVTMTDIATASGMAKKTLYAIFDDKEALLRELIGSSYIWPVAALDSREQDAVKELKLKLEVIANHVLSPRHINLCRLAIGESIRMDGLADAFYEMGIEKSRASLIQTLAKIDRARLRVALPPEMMAGMLFGVSCGLPLMSALLSHSQPDIRKAHRQIAKAIGEMFVDA
jgi:TetR/AcrR family transcriptional regulator, mexJK operon transcriptional repressor